MTLTYLEHREARAFVEDELLAENDSRRRRLLSLVQAALPAVASPHPDALPDGSLSKSTAKRLEILAPRAAANPDPGATP